jgi:hypothetical protein
MFNEVQVVSCIRGGVEMKCYADVLHFHYQDWYDEWPSVICMCVCLRVCIPVCLFVNKYVLFIIGTKHDRTDRLRLCGHDSHFISCTLVAIALLQILETDRLNNSKVDMLQVDLSQWQMEDNQ